MKSAIFLSARDKSKRLPKKHLLEIKGKSTMDHLISRLKTAKLPDLIVLCTSTNFDDSTLVEIAEKKGILFFRGSEEDKLDRYLKAAEKYHVDFIVVVDGDDIFCDPKCIDGAIKKFKETDADYIVYKDLPLGVTPFCVKYEALKRICDLKDENDTEAWGAYFTDTGLFKVIYMEADKELRHPEYRMTLDYKEDFDFFKAVFDKLYSPGKIFSLKEIINLLEKEQWLVDINSGVQKLFEAHFKKCAPVKLKKIL